jgi:hypothetical protein
MSDIQPDNTDAILGGQTPPPVNAAVLGGMAGEKQRLDREFGITHELSTFETLTVNARCEIFTRTQKSLFIILKIWVTGLCWT